MCEPVTLLSMALTGAQTVIGYNAAKDQFRSQMSVYQQNADQAALNTARNYSNLNVRIQQEGMAHAQQAQAAEVQKAQAIASTEVAAAAGGVSGLSVDAVLRDIYAQAGRNNAAADTNLRMNADYFAGEAQSIQAQGQSQINSVAIPERPSLTPFLIDGFAQGLNVYSGHINRKAG